MLIYRRAGKWLRPDVGTVMNELGHRPLLKLPWCEQSSCGAGAAVVVVAPVHLPCLLVCLTVRVRMHDTPAAGAWRSAGGQGICPCRLTARSTRLHPSIRTRDARLTPASGRSGGTSRCRPKNLAALHCKTRSAARPRRPRCHRRRDSPTSPSNTRGTPPQ